MLALEACTLEPSAQGKLGQPVTLLPAKGQEKDPGTVLPALGQPFRAGCPADRRIHLSRGCSPPPARPPPYATARPRTRGWTPAPVPGTQSASTLPTATHPDPSAQVYLDILILQSINKMNRKRS